MHDTNDHPRQDYNIPLTQHLLTIPDILVPVSFTFLVKYFVVLGNQYHNVYGYMM
jgi:hypothetical protein